MLHTALQQPINDRQHNTRSGVTELVLSRDCPDHAALLFPMLAFLSQNQEDRWITWIAPEGINKELLLKYGVDTSKIRLIHPTKSRDLRWILWEALSTGNSHTVLASPGKLNDKELRQLEQAAFQGESQGLLLRLR